ncbi:hypothetical protein GALMADRAFT_138548 [Galerina marginata CBS 339.88]|uniref:Uncharacterized protein n=1 Tax=Galerina marginata (strain CBS 339.88) TaxID=685588 RepID=A0A067T560_GALM3|nr:hypothetical protein GALMADRAFT_138548 [Galerina marginata CBS 339.88]
MPRLNLLNLLTDNLQYLPTVVFHKIKGGYEVTEALAAEGACSASHLSLSDPAKRVLHSLNFPALVSSHRKLQGPGSHQRPTTKRRVLPCDPDNEKCGKKLERLKLKQEIDESEAALRKPKTDISRTASQSPPNVSAN